MSTLLAVFAFAYAVSLGTKLTVKKAFSQAAGKVPTEQMIGVLAGGNPSEVLGKETASALRLYGALGGLAQTVQRWALFALATLALIALERAI